MGCKIMYIYTNIHAHICIDICVCVCAFVCVSVCVFGSLFISVSRNQCGYDDEFARRSYIGDTGSCTYI